MRSPTLAVVVLVCGYGFLRLIHVSSLSSLRSLAEVSEPKADSERAGNTPAQQLLRECFQRRFDAYWDAQNHSIQSFNEKCRLDTWVQHPSPSTTIRSDFEHTNPNLMKRLKGSCILLFGDSTDRQIIEKWCPRWSQKRMEVWMPMNKTSGKHIRDYKTANAVWNNAGIRCHPGTNVTFGTYLHYGVSEPPYWKFAHTYDPAIANDTSLDWGTTTNERVLRDVPKFFAECEGDRRVIIVQSYLWDLARQWFIYDTEQPPVEMIEAWAVNVTRLIQTVRTAVPTGTLVGWRYAGPLIAAKGRDTETILKMNQAIADVSRLGVDFVADYGAVLGSNLTRNPFPAHPPQHPLSLYLNLLFNAIFAAWEVEERS